MSSRSAFRHDSDGTRASTWNAYVAAAPRVDVLVESRGHVVRRLVVLGAHPDDETLGAGGLLSAAARADAVEVLVVVLTAGEASHPRSTTHSKSQVAARRRRECRAAIEQLGPDISVHHWQVPDGGVAAAEADCTARLVALLGDGRGTLLVAPWRLDGHDDHEAAGRIGASAAIRTGASLLEYPVWAWHWQTPSMDLAPSSVVLPLSPTAAAAKRQAISCYGSQTTALSNRPGDEVILTADMLEHFDRSEELFVQHAPADTALEQLHLDAAEPWGADTRWYEERKRSITLAMLPRREYARGLDVGCSTGVATRALAARCQRLLAVDGSASAAATAATRLADLGHVSVEHRRLPHDWPAGTFDLVVLSEVGYFLSPAELDHLTVALGRSLSSKGTVVLCHWRHPIHGWVLDADAVHRTFETGTGWKRIATYVDRDVEIVVLAAHDQLPDPHL